MCRCCCRGLTAAEAHKATHWKLEKFLSRSKMCYRHFVSCIFLYSPSKPLVFFASAVRGRQVASTCHHFCTQQSACPFLLAAGQEGLSQSAFGVCILPAEAHAYRSCTLETSSFGKYHFFFCSIILELRWAFYNHFCRSECMRTCEYKWSLLLHVLNLNFVPSKYWWSAFLYISVVSVYCMFGLQVPSASCSELRCWNCNEELRLLPQFPHS